MATGKTHSMWVTVDVNGVEIACSLSSGSNLGVTWENIDITTLCNELMENIKGQGTVDLSLSGYHDNSAPNGSFTVLQPLADTKPNQLVTVGVNIGIGAPPVAGDDRFEITNAYVNNYLVQFGTGAALTFTSQILGGEGVAAEWTTMA